MKLNTRKLRPDEIKVKIVQTNAGGVKLLLWKTPLADFNVLEDFLDNKDYEITYPREGCCRISIWDESKDTWVSKEGIGEGTTPKSIANDALSRAGTAWGIGRELFVQQEIFIHKDKLKSYKEETGEDGKTRYFCFDEFHVLDVQYKEDAISYLKIGIAQYGNVHHEVEFHFSSNSSDVTPDEEKKQEKQKAKPEVPKAEVPEEKKKEKIPEEPVREIYEIKKPEKAEDTPVKKEYLAPGETILMGNCKGKTYQEVKNTELFKSFLVWAAKSSVKYSDPDKNEQFARIKALAVSQCA